jgi:hypothetical protein
MKRLINTRPTIRPALTVAAFLWPYFWAKHDCVFVSFVNEDPEFNSPPKNDTATGWESFVNHTHIFDEFRNKTTKRVVVNGTENDILMRAEETYDDAHPDFIAAAELGRAAARFWALKLQHDFPSERFRVYYTEYDNPIVRFHKVRTGEEFWMSDEALRSSKLPDFRNALIYDTKDLTLPVYGPKLILN